MATVKVSDPKLLYLIALALLALGYGVYMALRSAPRFTLGVLLSVVLVLVYIQTETWLTHDANEFENRFWTFLACVFAFNCVFATDSPLGFGEQHPTLGWAAVALATFAAHNYHRHIMRSALSRVPNMRRVRSADFSMLEERTRAREKLSELRLLLRDIDRRWVSSTFLNIFLLAKVLLTERRIINIFDQADSEQLNYLVGNFELGLLFYKIKDHRFAHQYNRTKLLQLLAVERVTELTTASRAMLLDGFQRMKLSAHPQCEQWALSIVLKTKGDGLSELKSLTDSKGDFNSMHKLVYWDIRNAKVKEEILKHISVQANIQASHMILKTKSAKIRDKFAWRKIVSDVDDTLSCSGGSFPAGCDMSYPRKCIYPGVLAFYRELDLGTRGPDVWDSASRIGNLVFLSARPHLYKDLLESHSYEKFRRLQETSGMHTSPSLLPGEMLSGGEFFVKGSIEPMARKKYDNFREYLSLYPEFECVFIGDNGQGDVRAAEMLRVQEGGRYAANLRRTYIHEVLPVHLTYTENQLTRSYSDPHICYFKTYIEAALDAFKHGLIRLNGLRAVVTESKADFLAIPIETWAASEDTSAIKAEENRQMLLQKALQEETRLREKNAPKKSVADGDPADKNPGPKQTVDAPKKSGTLRRIPFRNQVHRPFKGVLGPGWKRELRLFEINGSISLVNMELKRLQEQHSSMDKKSDAATLYSLHLLQEIPLLRVPCRYPVGSVVRTEYGIGFVRHFRPQDGIYEVHVHWGGWQSSIDVLKCQRGAECSSCGDSSVDNSRGVTPCCVRGIFVKVFLLAGNMRPAPSSKVPAYNAPASIALPSTRTAIWQSVTGLLGGRNDPGKSGQTKQDTNGGKQTDEKAGDTEERPKIGRAINAIKSIWKGINDNAAIPEFLKDYYGALVWTPYGEGHILGVHRAERRGGSAKAKSGSGADVEDMVTIRLHWGAVCCIRRQSTTFLSGALEGVQVGIGAFPLRSPYESAPIGGKAIPKPSTVPDRRVEDLRALGSPQGAIFSYLKYSSPQRPVSATLMSDTPSPDFSGTSGDQTVHKLPAEDDRSPEPVTQGIESSMSPQLLKEGARLRAMSAASDATSDISVEAPPPMLLPVQPPEAGAPGSKAFFSNWLRFPMFYTNKDVDVDELIRGPPADSSSVGAPQSGEAEDDEGASLPRLKVGLSSRVNSEKHLLPSPAAGADDGSALRMPSAGVGSSKFFDGDEDEEEEDEEEEALGLGTSLGGSRGAVVEEGRDSNDALYF